MFETTTKKGKLAVSRARVIRMADRLFRLPGVQRAHVVERAKARIAGDRPTKRDAALVIAAG